MSKEALLIQYGWLIALLLTIGVSSWAVLLIQALFQEKRIALMGVFGSLLFAFVAVFPNLGPFAAFIKIIATAICLLFMVWFYIKKFNQPYVYMPLLLLLVCGLTAFWLYLKIV
ncbi:hypothetical protein [Marinicella litoralis]|uniref:Uncharacterized protein n=1 Tax=Marinicella litoralis TaxID=644220 RepID=A0A4R6XRL1_9GAMM|nr:hypothetical protein [Marinicella litoralis]TDR22535.1 hypothetical protein C8D91_1026 [Marinicella litoralis]